MHSLCLVAGRPCARELLAQLRMQPGSHCGRRAAADILELVGILPQVVHLAKVDPLKFPVGCRVGKFKVREIGRRVLYPETNERVVGVIFEVIIRAWWRVDYATGRQILDKVRLPPCC